MFSTDFISGSRDFTRARAAKNPFEPPLALQNRDSETTPFEKSRLRDTHNR